MAGECGNRTHPTLRSKVTVILKITEATRPHPPPFASVDFDRNLSPLCDFAYCYGSSDPGKIASDRVATDAYQEATRRLGVVENRAVLLTADVPPNEISQI